jgi:hypothetical protein
MAKKKSPKKIPKKKGRPKPKTPGKKTPGKKKGPGPGSPPKPKPKFYENRMRYNGVLLTEELTTAIKTLRKELIFKGCFYSYNTIIGMLYKHIRFYLLYHRDPEEKYPCEHKFNLVAREIFIIDIDNYFHNGAIDEVDDFRMRKGFPNMVMYFRSMQGAVKRFKLWSEYHERIQQEFSILWKTVEDFVAAGGVDSPMIEVTVGYEEITGVILIDFRGATCSGFPVKYFLPYALPYYEAAGLE